MVLTGCATVLALRLLPLLCPTIKGSCVSFKSRLTAASLVSILVSVSRLTSNLGIFSLTGDAKSCVLSGEGAIVLLGFSFMGGILVLSLVIVVEVVSNFLRSNCTGELLIGFSFTCSKMLGSFRCGFGDGEGNTGILSGLSRICLLIIADVLNFLLLFVRIKSAGCSITSSTGLFSVEFRFSTALATILALDDCCGRNRRCCTVCSAL